MKAKIMKPTSEENATLPRIQAYSTALQNELARTGYSDKAILLTPAQVGLIFRFLGEP